MQWNTFAFSLWQEDEEGYNDGEVDDEEEEEEVVGMCKTNLEKTFALF